MKKMIKMVKVSILIWFCLCLNVTSISAKVYKKIYFGSYWQNSDKYREPISWIVLYQDGNEALLLSEKILSYNYWDSSDIKYQNNVSYNTYENSTVRKWLNRKFLYDIFPTEEERNALLLENHEYYYKNSSVDWDGHYETVQDKIFLPSLNDLSMVDKKFLSAQTTKWIKQQKFKYCIFKRGNYYGDYWTSDHAWGSNAFYVSIDGKYGALQEMFNKRALGIRPSIRLNLNSKNWSELTIKKTDAKGRTAILQWTKVLDAKGYQLRVYNQSNPDKKKVINTKKRSYKFKGKEGWYVAEVRNYTIKKGKKIYGNWSSWGFKIK